MRNALSIHISDKPDATEMASALRVLAVFAGFTVFNDAVDMIGDVPGVANDTPRAAVPIPPAPSAPPAPGSDDMAGDPVSDVVLELDSQGLPWNEAINAGTKAKNADGTWKKRRGVQESIYDKTVAEMRAQYPAPIAAAPSAIPAPPPPAPPPPAPDAPGAIPPPPPAPPPPSPLADNSAAPTNFGEFMRAAGQYFVGNRITMADINGITSQLGYASPIEMKKAPNEGAGLWEMAFDLVKAKVAEKA